MDHLAYCDSKAKEMEKLLSGKKSMLVRGAAGRKIPYGRVFAGEIIYLLENDGKGFIRAKGLIKSVFNSEKLSEAESKKIILDNMDKLQLTDLQMKRWIGKKYLCLIEIGDVKEISPFTYARAGNMDDWIIVDSIEEIKNEIQKDQ